MIRFTFKDGKQLNLLKIRYCINALLNSEGGVIQVGHDANGNRVGVRNTWSQRDEFRCQIDSLVNAMAPEVDADCIRIRFTNIREHEYAISIFVFPGLYPVYYISLAEHQAFSVRNSIVTELTQREIEIRYSTTRSLSLQLESWHYHCEKREIFEYSIINFLSSENARTKVACLELEKGKAGEKMSQSITRRLKYDEIVEVDFEKYEYLDDVYTVLIQQLKPSFQNYYPERVKITANGQLHTIDDVFTDFCAEQRECEVLQNVYQNLFKDDLRYLLVLYNASIAIDRFIPLNCNIIVIATGNYNISIEGKEYLEIKHYQIDDNNYQQLFAISKVPARDNYFLAENNNLFHEQIHGENHKSGIEHFVLERLFKRKQKSKELHKMETKHLLFRKQIILQFIESLYSVNAKIEGIIAARHEVDIQLKDLVFEVEKWFYANSDCIIKIINWSINNSYLELELYESIQQLKMQTTELIEHQLSEIEYKYSLPPQ